MNINGKPATLNKRTKVVTLGTFCSLDEYAWKPVIIEYVSFMMTEQGWKIMNADGEDISLDDLADEFKRQVKTLAISYITEEKFEEQFSQVLKTMV